MLIYGIVNLLYGLLQIFLLDSFMNPLFGWNNPLSPRVVGGSFIGITIFVVLSIRKNNWEQVKMTYEFMYYLLILVLIMESTFFVIAGSTLNAAATSQVIMDIILMLILLALGVYSYMKQRG